jgi:hypothetical protein
MRMADHAHHLTQAVSDIGRWRSGQIVHPFEDEHL